MVSRWVRKPKIAMRSQKIPCRIVEEIKIRPDGNLYVSANGFAFPAGAGQILKVQLH
jgi:hypothetical protein